MGADNADDTRKRAPLYECGCTGGALTVTEEEAVTSRTGALRCVTHGAPLARWVVLGSGASLVCCAEHGWQPWAAHPTNGDRRGCAKCYPEWNVVEEPASSKVDHPAHYGGAANAYEAIKVIEAWGLGFHLGNAVKYIARAGKKSNETLLDDLRKARWYLDRAITKLESKG